MRHDYDLPLVERIIRSENDFTSNSGGTIVRVPVKGPVTVDSVADLLKTKTAQKVDENTTIHAVGDHVFYNGYGAIIQFSPEYD